MGAAATDDIPSIDTAAAVVANTPLPPTPPADDRPISELRAIPKMPSLPAEMKNREPGDVRAVPLAPPPPSSIYEHATSAQENQTPVAVEGSGPHRLPSEATLVEDLFDALHLLNFKENLEEGAHFVLEVARDLIPSRAAAVHLYDLNRGDYVVVAARGPRSGPVTGTRAPQSDPFISPALRKEAVTQRSIESLEDTERPSRVRALTPLRSILIAPCQKKRQDVGAIELYDSIFTDEFSDAEMKAVAYLAEAFTRFVLEHGLQVETASKPAQSA